MTKELIRQIRKRAYEIRGTDKVSADLLIACANTLEFQSDLYANSCMIGDKLEKENAELTDKLEMALEDIQLSCVCATCKYFEGVTTNANSWVCEQCFINNQYRVPTNWKWRGDTE